MIYDATGNPVEPHEVLDPVELADHYAAARDRHPAGKKRPRLRILPAVDPDTGEDADGWWWRP